MIDTAVDSMGDSKWRAEYIRLLTEKGEETLWFAEGDGIWGEKKVKV